MSCLDNIPQCNGKPEHYYIWCNYYSGGFKYIPEGNHTCYRENERIHNNFIDCCLENKEDCCIQSGSANPTAFPTIAPTQFCINNNDYFASRPISCSYFERIKSDITFKKNNKIYCCAINTGECCELNTNYIFIISGIMLIFIIMVYSIMRKAQTTISRITPDETMFEII